MNNNLAQHEEQFQGRVSSMWTFLFITVVALSNFSQLPALVSIGATNLLSMPIWLIFGIILLIKCRFELYFSARVISFYKLCAIFIFLVFILDMFTNGGQISGSLFRSFLISLMVFSIGCVSSGFIDSITIDKMEIAYILSMIIVSINIYFQYFVGYDISSIAYGYSSKNSVSTMLLAAVVFLVFGLNELSFIKKRILIRGLITIYFIVLMGLMKSRASICGLAVVLAAIILSPKVRQWQKNLIIVVVIVGAVYVLNTPTAYDLIVNDILYAGRDADSISSLSSGRTDLVVDTLRLLSKKFFCRFGFLLYRLFPSVSMG